MEFDMNFFIHVLVAVIAIIFLFVSLVYNFIPGEHIPVKRTINHLRTENVYYEEIDKINMSPSNEPINYKLLSNRKGELNNVFSEILFINGNVELGKQISNNCLIEFNNDTIYNLKINNKITDGITVYMWNNSKTLKGIKFNNKIEGKNTKMITLSSNMLICLDYKDETWKLNDMNFFESDRNVYNKYIVKRCYNLLMNEIIMVSESSNELVDDLNNFIKHNTLGSDIDILKTNTEYTNNILDKLKEKSTCFDFVNSSNLIERLINVNGCIFLECNFNNDEDLNNEISSMIEICLTNYRESISEYISLSNLMLNNTLLIK